jgi:hypothetical protein
VRSELLPGRKHDAVSEAAGLKKVSELERFEADSTRLRKGRDVARRERDEETKERNDELKSRETAEEDLERLTLELERGRKGE